MTIGGVLAVKTRELKNNVTVNEGFNLINVLINCDSP